MTKREIIWGATVGGIVTVVAERLFDLLASWLQHQQVAGIVGLLVSAAITLLRVSWAFIPAGLVYVTLGKRIETTTRVSNDSLEEAVIRVTRSFVEVKQELQQRIQDQRGAFADAQESLATRVDNLVEELNPIAADYRALDPVRQLVRVLASMPEPDGVWNPLKDDEKQTVALGHRLGVLALRSDARGLRWRQWVPGLPRWGDPA